MFLTRVMNRTEIAKVASDFPSRLDATLRLMALQKSIFARRIDMDASIVTAWLRKDKIPSVSAFERIKTFLGKPAANYLQGSTDTPPRLVMRSAKDLKGEAS
jgi:hypothetical protein